MSPKKAESGGNLTNNHINKERKFNYSPWVTFYEDSMSAFLTKLSYNGLTGAILYIKKILNSFKLHIKGKAATVCTGKLNTKIYPEC
jgi:hypothetical protein